MIEEEKRDKEEKGQEQEMERNMYENRVQNPEEKSRYKIEIIMMEENLEKRKYMNEPQMKIPHEQLAETTEEKEGTKNKVEADEGSWETGYDSRERSYCWYR